MPAAALYDWLMLLHILGAMVWLGCLVALTVLASQALRGGHDSVARFVGNLRIVGPVALAPAAAAVLAFGIWMVTDSPAWDFGQTWVWLALALLVAAVAIGAVYLSGRALAAGRAVEAGDPDQVARQLRRWSWGVRLILVLLVVTTWDMVFKPGLG